MEEVEDLRSLGDMLRRAREEQGLSIEEAEGHTRIRRKYLEAFEIGNFSILPSSAHAKGFLRNYAAFLRMDANAVVARFSELSGVTTGTMTRPTAPQFRQPPPPSNRPGTGTYARPDTGTYDRQTGGSTYIPPERQVGPATPLPSQSIRRSSIPLPGTLGAAFNREEKPVAEQQSEVEPEAVQQNVPRAEGTLLTRVIRSPFFTVGILVSGLACVLVMIFLQISGGETEPIETLPAVTDNTEGEPLVIDTPNAPGPEPVTPTVEPDEEGIVGIPEILQGRVILSIEVVQRSWTRITVDDEVVYQELAQPGLILQYEGQDAIQVYTGNGAGLEITYNGQNLGPMGTRGEVVDRSYSAEGAVIEPTATPTVTPTNTAVPSPTPVGNVNPDQAEQN